MNVKVNNLADVADILESAGYEITKIGHVYPGESKITSDYPLSNAFPGELKPFAFLCKQREKIVLVNPEPKLSSFHEYVLHLAKQYKFEEMIDNIYNCPWRKEIHDTDKHYFSAK